MKKLKTPPKPKAIRLAPEQRFTKFFGAGTVDRKGKLHGVGKPAIKYFDGAEEWWTHGRLQGQNGNPALSVGLINAGPRKALSFGGCPLHEVVELTPNSLVWCEDGYIHRDGQPAIMKFGPQSGQVEEWWERGFRHRTNGPAVIWPHRDMWFENGLLHRVDGPAVHYKALSGKMAAFSSAWYSAGQKMYVDGKFLAEFDYGSVSPEFVLTALAHVYEHVWWATVCEDAVLRASIFYPDLGVLLGAASNDISCGQFIAQKIRQAINKEAIECDHLSVDGLLEEI